MFDLYIDMSCGVAGDMLLAALLHSNDNVAKNKAYLISKLASLNLGEKIKLTDEVIKVNGITSLRIRFSTPEDDWARGEGAKEAKSISPKEHHHHHHHHRHFTEIKRILTDAKLSPFVKRESIKTFELLGRAEAKVHDQDLANIHFHEVGSLDAILEIVSFYLLIEKYKIKKIFSSPIVLGSGYVNCEHGKMPVPVPAVVEMLKIKKAPFRKVSENTGELTTPTGLALVLNSNDAFAFPERQTIANLGYGAGHKEIKGFTNVVRVLQLQSHDDASDKTVLESDEVVEIKATIDDMTGEEMALLLEQLFSLNVLDVTYKSILMKKGRIGYEISILADPSEQEKIGSFLLKNSSTLGYRYGNLLRKKLVRRTKTITINNGAGEAFPLLVKEAYWGDKLLKKKIEFDSLKETLYKSGLTKEEILSQVGRFYETNFKG